jgi:hypothetical protein
MCKLLASIQSVLLVASAPCFAQSQDPFAVAGEEFFKGNYLGAVIQARRFCEEAFRAPGPSQGNSQFGIRENALDVLANFTHFVGNHQEALAAMDLRSSLVRPVTKSS